MCLTPGLSRSHEMFETSVAFNLSVKPSQSDPRGGWHATPRKEADLEFGKKARNGRFGQRTGIPGPINPAAHVDLGLTRDHIASHVKRGLPMLAEPDVVANVLGLRPARRRTTPFQLISSIEAGLPVEAVDRLARAIAPADAEFRHRFVPRATLARRKNDPEARLTVAQSDRLARSPAFGRTPYRSGKTRTRRGPSCSGHILCWKGAGQLMPPWGPSLAPTSSIGCRRAGIRISRVIAHILDRVLKAYRIGDPDGRYPIYDATGSRLYPGRWNTPASPMLYTSEHYSTALLEKLVHGSGVLRRTSISSKLPFRAGLVTRS